MQLQQYIFPLKIAKNIAFGRITRRYAHLFNDGALPNTIPKQALDVHLSTLTQEQLEDLTNIKSMENLLRNIFRLHPENVSQFFFDSRVQEIENIFQGLGNDDMK